MGHVRRKRIWHEETRAMPAAREYCRWPGGIVVADDPPRRSEASARSGLARRATGFAAMVMLGAMVWSVIAPPSPNEAQRPIRSTGRIADWTTAVRPGTPARFPSLEGRVALTGHGAGRDRASGAREVWTSYGAFKAGPHVHVDLALGVGPPTGSLFVDLARRASAQNLSVLRVTRPVALATGLGDAEVAEATLSDGGTGERTRTCLAFRLHDAVFDLGVTGWTCETGPVLMSGDALACLLEGLSAPDGDPILSAALAHGTARPSACRTKAKATLPPQIKETAVVHPQPHRPNVRGRARPATF